MKLRKFMLSVSGSLIGSLLLANTLAYADTLTVKLYKVAAGNAQGEAVGTVNLTDTQYGLLITPNLQNISPGWHGFHIHQNPSCANNGEAAGPHFDPHLTNQHLGPYNSGHLGDLPALAVQADGTDTQVVIAPRLKVAQLKGHSLMIHANGDNYSDKPLPLGGGGARIICGVAK